MEVVLYLEIMTSLMVCFHPPVLVNNNKGNIKFRHIRRHCAEMMHGVKILKRRSSLSSNAYILVPFCYRQGTNLVYIVDYNIV